MRIFCSISLFIIFLVNANGQDTIRSVFRPRPFVYPSDTAEKRILQGKIIDGDTVAIVDVGAAVIFPESSFKNAREAYKYDRLVYNVRKVYPYAKMAAAKLTEYKHILDSLPNDKQRKKFIKKAQKELEAQFGDEVKSLTYSQGKVLIKLIYRETGNSSYDIIRELRGGFEAFILQNMARVFGYDLKTRYDPEGNDRAIEKIVQLIEAGVI